MGKSYTLYELFLKSYGQERINEIHYFCDMVELYGFYGNRKLRSFEYLFTMRKTFTINKKILYKALRFFGADESYICYSKNICSETNYLLSKDIIEAKNKKQESLEKVVNYFYNYILFIGMRASVRYQLPINDAIQDSFLVLQESLEIINKNNIDDFEYYICKQVEQDVKEKIIANEKENINIPQEIFFNMIDEYLYLISKKDVYSLTKKFSIGQLNRIIAYLSGVERKRQIANMDCVYINNGLRKNKEKRFYSEIWYEWIRKNLLRIEYLCSEVLIERYGLYDGKIKTLDEVGRILGIKYEQVKKIEKKALQKLRGRDRLI